MSFLNIFFIWSLLISIMVGRGNFHINRSFDLDEDGNLETFAINTRTSSAIWVEFSGSDKIDTLWTYNLPKGQKFSDLEITDLDNDGFEDIIIIPDLFASIGSSTWLYVFQGSKEGFSNKPYTYKDLPFEISTLRPSSLSLVPGGPHALAVSFGAPIRYSLVFNIDISNERIDLKNIKVLSAPIIENGYGAVYVGGFISDGESYIAMISPEKNTLKVALFDISMDFILSKSGSIPIEKSRYILGSDLQPFHTFGKTYEEGLLVPFASDDVFLLTLKNSKLFFPETSLSGKNAFPIKDEGRIRDLFKLRQDIEIYNITQVENISVDGLKGDKKAIIPPSDILTDKEKNFDSLTLEYEKNVKSILPREKSLDVESKTKDEKDYSTLSPTLGDFLANAKSKTQNKKINLEKIQIPKMNSDMQSVNWADEAGFTKLDLGEYIPEASDTIKEKSSIPNMDTEITTFTKKTIDALSPKVINKDTMVNQVTGNDIDLYYVLAMTPSSATKDRYVFDGEAPFGVAVNQIPQKGEPTHFQHGISANLANLNFGETFDFAYSLRDSQLDSITTLTMVHDMQTNVVFMSISPTDDSLSQSYQPESFDPKLFEFPDYFFEGFPNSLDMDFTQKLIRFTFDKTDDSLYQGIYLSSTTPSLPSQSLAVFMDEGILQAIRGEIVVRANGSKKVTTEFDLIGSVEPAVMFSRLIQEFFPEELKIKLLQGGSLEEPIFGPKGKIPKVYREPRLPDAQPEQQEPKIPISPKQSNIPKQSLQVDEVKLDSIKNVPQTQKDEESPKVLEVEKIELNIKKDSSDSLKLEEVKNILPKKTNDSISETDKNQPEPNIDSLSKDEG